VELARNGHAPVVSPSVDLKPLPSSVPADKILYAPISWVHSTKRGVRYFVGGREFVEGQMYPEGLCIAVGSDVISFRHPGGYDVYIFQGCSSQSSDVVDSAPPVKEVFAAGLL